MFVGSEVPGRGTDGRGPEGGRTEEGAQDSIKAGPGSPNRVGGLWHGFRR